MVALVSAGRSTNPTSTQASIRFSSISPAPGSRSNICSITRLAPRSQIRSARPPNRKPSATCSGSGEQRYEFVANCNQIRIELRFSRAAAAPVSTNPAALDSDLGGIRSFLGLVLGRPRLRTGRPRILRPLDSRLVLHSGSPALFSFAPVQRRSCDDREHVRLPQLALLSGPFVRAVVRLLQRLGSGTGDHNSRRSRLSPSPRSRRPSRGEAPARPLVDLAAPTRSRTSPHRIAERSPRS